MRSRYSCSRSNVNCRSRSTRFSIHSVRLLSHSSSSISELSSESEGASLLSQLDVDLSLSPDSCSISSPSLSSRSSLIPGMASRRPLPVEAPRVAVSLERGEFLEVLNSSDCEEIFAESLSSSLDEPLDELLEKGAQLFLDKRGADAKEAVRLLCVGVAALSAWLQHSSCGPPLPAEASVNWVTARRGSGATEEASSLLERPAHGDACAAVPLPVLLLLARASLRPCAHWVELQTGAWWWMRAVFAHQHALGEPVQALHEELATLLEAGPPPLSGGASARALLWLEAARVHLWFGYLVPARAALESARQAAGLTINLIGAMGKRTRFQQKELAQLTLQVEVDENCQQQPLRISDSLPKDLRLDDEVRLDRVEFTREDDRPSLPSLSPVQQAVVLSTFSMVQRSQPHDELSHEELLPYLQVVLTEPQLWSVQAAALVLRSRLECKERRTAERAMSQLQELVSATESSTPGVVSRLRALLAVPMPSSADVQCELANSLVRLGCVQSALDLFLQLKRWEEAVGCYTLLDLRHQAAELLRKELAVRESVPLLCLLGDATDDTTQYERAWAVSEQRSARAQRHWAMHHFRRQEYAESIPHLQLSLQCNSLQPDLWRRLGYATLDSEDWQLCASAYRRCVELDPENMEAWNNLAKAYVKTGQKARAWHALQEALKADYENWKLWDNVAVVSADIGAFDEVVRAYHRLLDLRSGRHVDIPVLKALVRAITSDVTDSEGQTACRMRPQALALFGRITSQVTADAEVWQLYAELTASLPEQTPQTLERTAQYLQRAHRAATQRQGWARQRDSCRETLALSTHLADAYLTCAQARTDPQRLLSSARLSVKGVLTAVRQQVELAAEFSCEVEELERKLAAVEGAIQAALEQ